MTAITTASPATTFRSKAADLMKDTASLTLHELVSEFDRLTAVMDQNVDDAGDYPRLNEAGQLAARERRLVNGAIRCRFGLSIESFDRACDHVSDSMSF